MASIELFRIMMFGVLFTTFSRALSFQILIPLGREQDILLSIVFAMIINITLNFFLIPILGGVGAAIATVVGEGVILIIRYVQVRHIINFKWPVRDILIYIVACLVLFALLVFIRGLQISLTLQLVLSIFLGGVGYFMTLLLLKESCLKSLFTLFKGKMA